MAAAAASSPSRPCRHCPRRPSSSTSCPPPRDTAPRTTTSVPRAAVQRAASPSNMPPPPNPPPASPLPPTPLTRSTPSGSSSAGGGGGGSSGTGAAAGGGGRPSLKGHRHKGSADSISYEPHTERDSGEMRWIVRRQAHRREWRGGDAASRGSGRGPHLKCPFYAIFSGPESAKESPKFLFFYLSIFHYSYYSCHCCDIGK